MGNQLKPKFNKTWPKGGLRFFSPAGSTRFRAEHPREYRIITTCAAISMLLPPFLDLVIAGGVFHAPNSPWLMLGFAGAFVFGIGLYNIAAAWMEQYLGHLLTMLSFTVGAAMVAASLLPLFDVEFSALFDKRMVSFYFLYLLLLCLPPLYYALFRGAADIWLRQKRISKTMIRKLKKGKANFWWYQALHEKYGLGAIYFINRVFTVLYPTALLLHLIFGWIKIISVPTFFLSALCNLLASFMFMFSGCQFHKDAFGRPFVLLARLPGGKYQSTLFDLFTAAVPLAVAYVQLKILADLWSFPL